MVSSFSDFALLRGPLIGRQHPDYEEARKLYNGMIDKRPLMIARCADVADVITAINFGRDNGLLIAIRGGGHNGPGLGSCDDGLVIDLSMMKSARVDPASRTVRVGPGCTQGDVDHATHLFGLAVPAGIVSTTGIAGLALGGGTGYLTRKLASPAIISSRPMWSSRTGVSSLPVRRKTPISCGRSAEAAEISVLSPASCSKPTQSAWSTRDPSFGIRSTLARS